MTLPPAPQSPPSDRPAPGTDLGADLTAGLSFAVAALTRNLVPFLVAGVLYSVLFLLILGGGLALGIVLALPFFEASATDESAAVPAMLLVYAGVLASMVLILPVSLLWQSGTLRAGGEVLAGGRPTVGQALRGSGRVMLTSLLVMLATFVGVLLCYVPGLIIAVLLSFALPAAAHGASPVEACKESIALVRANLGTTIVAVLIGSAISSIAGMLVITVVVVVPFASLFLLGIYERLSGRALVDPARA